MNISLPDEMRAFVEAQVASGQFANASDYIRNLIRYDRRELDLLRAAVDEGDAADDSRSSIEAVIADEAARLRDR